jgi:hypothetical protein
MEYTVKNTPSYVKYKSWWKMVQIEPKLKTHQRTEMFIMKSHFGFNVLCILHYALFMKILSVVRVG